MPKERQPKIPWDSEAELDLLRHYCLTSFWPFFMYGYGAAFNPRARRWVDEDVHKPLADWFEFHVRDWMEKRRTRQEGEDGEQKHLIVIVHREVGKTSMISVAGQAWLHLLDSELSSYTGAESLPLSGKVMEAIKSIMDGSDPYAMWAPLFGNWAASARSWTGKSVRHAMRRNTARTDPSLGIFAVETSITGAHPDAIFYDDPISYERLESDSDWLDRVNSQIESLIPVLQSDGLFVRVGTRYDQSDDIGLAIANEGVASLSGMPTDSIVVDPDEGQHHVYFMAARDEDGNPTTPKVWPEKRLQRYAKKNPLRYAAQVMNDPESAGHNPLTRGQIEQCQVSLEEVPLRRLRIFINCDTAFADGVRIQRKDETVLLVQGIDRDGSGDVYVLEGMGAFTWRAEDFAKRLISTVQRYRARGLRIAGITDELYSSGGKRGSWRMALQNRFADVNEPMPAFHEFNRYGTSKKLGGDTNRLVTAASFWVDGHVRIVRGAPGTNRLMDQMARIGQYMINNRIKIDWADAHADIFHPEIYTPMRRNAAQPSPYLPGARPVAGTGVDPRAFQDGPDDQWLRDNPRPPLR